MRPVRSTSALLLRLAGPALSFLVSVSLHLLLSTPFLVLWWLGTQRPDDLVGEEVTEDSQVGDDGGEVPLGEPNPVRVSMYVEPTETPTPAAEAAVATGPAAAPAKAPARQGTANGNADTSYAERMAERAGVRGRRPRGDRKPCEEIEEIVPLGDDRWRVERDIIDYYAMHRKELENHVGVATHRGDGGEGRPDGARIFLPRCSLLRQAGFRHGDIVNSINGRRVATLTDAIAAYLFLRNDENLRVEITRKNGDKLTLRYRLKR